MNGYEKTNLQCANGEIILFGKQEAKESGQSLLKIFEGGFGERAGNGGGTLWT